MILIAPLFLRIFAGKFVNAMALWPFILVRNKETKESKVIINHEKNHIRQQLELFIVPFYLLYLIYYILYRLKKYNHMQAYFHIPFEREAYAEESNLSYLKTRKIWNWRFYLN